MAAVSASAATASFPLASARARASISQLELRARRLLLPWTGLCKHVSFTHLRSVQVIKEKKARLRGKVVHASLFGVGAPEALVIGVVALLVFGPKGLAEIARNLGKTLRAFQPTIKELQDVSREFKSTLEREIGLDEIPPSTSSTYKPLTPPNESQQAEVGPNGTPKSEAHTSEDLLKITSEQLAASAGGSESEGSNPQEQQDGVVAEAPLEVTASSNPDSDTQLQSSMKADKEG